MSLKFLGRLHDSPRCLALRLCLQTRTIVTIPFTLLEDSVKTLPRRIVLSGMRLQHVCLSCLRHGRRTAPFPLALALPNKRSIASAGPLPSTASISCSFKRHPVGRRHKSTEANLNALEDGPENNGQRPMPAYVDMSNETGQVTVSEQGTRGQNPLSSANTGRSLRKSGKKLGHKESTQSEAATAGVTGADPYILRQRRETSRRMSGRTVLPRPARKLVSKLGPRKVLSRGSGVSTPSREQPRLIESVRNNPIAIPPSATSSSHTSPQRTAIRIADLNPDDLQTIAATNASITPVYVEDIDVPQLSFDLHRVLFNPGVYQLQDPRSRLYNFDPYLEKIMPVTEFDFEALNAYVTSSEDDKLRDLALQSSKRYIGSSSSMTTSLSQFHFLLSAWRGPNFQKLSKGFKLDSENFTKLTRAPSAVFLRWRDGVYAMDADKEFDSANILMSLGKSIEKLLTLEKDDFEKYRRSKKDEIESLPEKPEQYHYGEIGNFLMRSQLDAHDPRLPGSGMFDLKTRAVAPVRMSLSDHERALGYEIKDLFGTWESYEREYYDMIRSAFLKYSLQVRMGRMDGIFVAFHNIERIFGFQYISLAEMDQALHGQSHPVLGDQEFGMSVKLMEEIFDRATEKFPEQSLRVYFEVREPTEKMEPVAYMNVFAEPVADKEIEQIQQAAKVNIEAYEQRIFNQIKGGDEKAVPGTGAITSSDATQDSASELSSEEVGAGIDMDLLDADPDETGDSSVTQTDTAAPSKTSSDAPSVESEPYNSDADIDFLESLSDLELPENDRPSAGEHQTSKSSEPTASSTSLVGFKVLVRSKVNGRVVPRVEGLKPDEKWELDYTISEYTPARAASKYRMCKARRVTALSQALTKDDDNDFFLARLLRMSEAGREWRKQLDELDTQKQPVVLYNLDGAEPKV